MISGFTVQYQVNGSDDGAAMQRMRVAFERMSADLTDFSAFVWPRLVPVLEEEERRQFDSEGEGPNRGSWAQLSPAYAARKDLEWPGRPILERTGALREALTSSGSSYARRITTATEFDFGTIGIEYASFHQLGTERMPDRPPFDFGGAAEQAIQQAALEGVREAMTHSGVSEFAGEGADWP